MKKNIKKKKKKSLSVEELEERLEMAIVERCADRCSSQIDT